MKRLVEFPLEEGGSILVQIDGDQTTYTPLLTAHRAFVNNKAYVSTPLCLEQLAVIN